MQAYVSPPIAAVFLAGLLWRREGKGAFTTLIAGFILGAICFVAELGVNLGWVTWPPLVTYATLDFLHFAILLFVISLAILVLVSLTSMAPNTTHMSIFEVSGDSIEMDKGGTAAHQRNVFQSWVLAAIVLVLWAVFSSLVFAI